MLAITLSAGPALAAKPEWAGQGHGQGQGHDKGEPGEHGQGKKGPQRAPKGAAKAHGEPKVGGYFTDEHRAAVRGYYGEHYGGAKRCPPGLAKKNNGCMPPGQAKKWAVGQPLPAGVTVYPVPQAVIVQLPPPPRGYKYVRVASDILLIAVGTSMVVDGISDLMR
jgi:Ni/Co efflux regulator RcnB